MLDFGTDGVRGPSAEFTSEWLGAFARALVDVLGPGPFVLGRDTRRSGPDITERLTAAVRAAGGAVADLGVAPTPAVAWVAADTGWPGVVVSASHNPFDDNGLKVFAAGGTKLDDDTERRLAAALSVALAAGSAAAGPATDVEGPAVPSAAAEGTAAEAGSDPHGVGPGWGAQALERYVDHVVTSLPPDALAGLRVVLDCANGAASEVAPQLFARLGADVVALHHTPDGRNINAGCGSTHLEVLAGAVPARGADLGLAFDGDADRVLAVDAEGATVDGDQIIAMLALDRHRRATLAGPAVVVTVMSNLGLRLAMAEAGIEVVETPVGDRHCLAALEARGLTLGGEQSGHVILADLATTGDGLLCGAHLASLVAGSGTSLGALAAASMTRLPQVLRNVEVTGDRSAVVAAVADELAAAEAELGASGRVLLRPSGTEPLVRVMVEAPASEVAAEVAERLAAAISAAAGAPGAAGERQT